MTINFNPNQDFLFASPWRNVYTHSYLKPLAYPPNTVFNINSSQLTQTVRDCFSRLDSAIASHAIIAGCMPFDAMEPASLYLIEQPYFCQRDELLAMMRASIPSNSVSNAIMHRQPLMSESVYKMAVTQAVEAIQQQRLSKVVLAQAQVLTLHHPVNMAKVLTHLLIENPFCYTYSVPVVGEQVFIGASPELLVRKEGNLIECFPLAGTAPRDADPKQDQLNASMLLSSMKNKHEHQLVVEDIVRKVAPLVTNLTVSESPELVCTSKVWHLGSKVKAVVADDYSVLDFVALFHPTPALCGTPREEAAAFIQVAEPFSRHYFSGAVGWCDAQGNGEWAVAIRCALIKEHQAIVYAGAGIVSESDPEEEWVETMNKQKVIIDSII